MARLKKTVLGRVSGAVGDIVFREKNGKNFVGLRASSFMPGLDIGSIERRNKFSLSTQLASTINSNPKLKSIWLKSISPKRNAYVQLIRVNYPNLTVGNVSDFVKIVPELGFIIKTREVILHDDLISVITDPIGDNAGIDPSVELNVQLAAIIFLSNPIDESVKLYNFISLLSDVQLLKLDEGYTFEINLSNQHTFLASKYQNRRGFFSLLTLSSEDKVINYSSTFVS